MRRWVASRGRRSASGRFGGEWRGWLAVAGLGLAFAAALFRWGEVVFHGLMVVSAAVWGAFVGYWLVAEWTNLDDRGMVGAPFPLVVVVASTGLGAMAAGGLVLLITLRWG